MSDHLNETYRILKLSDHHRRPALDEDAMAIMHIWALITGAKMLRDMTPYNHRVL
ncbi:hypothetical protein [Phaeovulum sp. W22_SRMD_FR3]|uniref:hypothetical protein n=1 Tax=Phaeovulum sp. W22_SRMD_FR3 TaxID=3240274 RepID=UPI003F9A2561